MWIKNADFGCRLRMQVPIWQMRIGDVEKLEHAIEGLGFEDPNITVLMRCHGRERSVRAAQSLSSGPAVRRPVSRDGALAGD